MTGKKLNKNSTFYVHDNNDNLVEAKFLLISGQPVIDPNYFNAKIGGAPTNIKHAGFFNADGSQIEGVGPDGPNPNGWLIIPATDSYSNIIDYVNSLLNIQKQAITLAQQVTDPYLVANIIAGGEISMLSKAGSDLGTDGPEDVQTNNLTIDGKPANFVGAFIDAASYRLGLISALAEIPEPDPIIVRGH